MTHDNLLDSNLVTKERVDVDSNLASTGQRVGNFIIDMIAAYVLLFVLLGVMGLSFTELGQGESIVYELGTRLLYYLVLEAAFGKTLGKMITRTHVVDMNGDKPNLAIIIGRTLSRVIPFDALSFLSGRPGWHDTISGTRVVND